VPAGEFSASERYEIDRTIRAAEQSCRFEFSVFVGHAEGDPHGYATRLHASLVAPARSILVLVDPGARAIEVVTGAEVRRHLSDVEVEHGVLNMRSDFAGGDLVGGLKRAITYLAEHARAPQTLHAE
jgi:uncharacterized membrane protein YgcG